MDELNKAQELQKQVRLYVSALKKLKKLQDIGGSMYLQDVTLSAMRRNRDAMHLAGEHVERLAHEVHCLCVELGIAKYEEWRYGTKSTSAPMGSMNHGQAVHMRQPAQQ